MVQRFDVAVARVARFSFHLAGRLQEGEPTIVERTSYESGD
jgi:hypothetical protein